MFQSDGIESFLNAQYQYDAQNRRITKTVGQTATHFFFNESWQVLEARVGSGPDPLDQYLWDIRYIDAAVVRFHDADTNGSYEDAGDNILYYTQDANFNTTALVDEATGDVAERYLYDPYGKATVLEDDWTADGDNASDVANVRLFQGQEFNPETGLDSSRMRPVYHPTLGVWASRDIPYVDGMNLYAYCGADPVNRVDPTGMREVLGNGIEVLPNGRVVFDPATDSTSGMGQEAAAERRQNQARYSAGAVPTGLGVGSVVLINGKTGFRIGITDYYITGSSQPGYPGKNTSALIIYKASNPGKNYRLDLGKIPRGPNKGEYAWHHNQEGLYDVVKIEDHTKAGPVASTAGKAIKIFKWGGRALFVTSAVASTLEVYYADDKARAFAREAAGWAGAAVGTRGGAWFGARVGVRYGPWGLGIGTLVGGIGGGIGGYLAAYNSADAIWELAASKLEVEEWQVLCEENGNT